LRQQTPRVASACSRSVKRRRASPRDMARPAPWLQLLKLSGLPFPRTMYERARVNLISEISPALKVSAEEAEDYLDDALAKGVLKAGEKKK